MLVQISSRFYLLLLLLIFSCQSSPETGPDPNATQTEVVETKTSPTEKYQKLFAAHPAYRADGFDFPVGKPNAKGYYNAQGFGGKSHHLGDDWNSTAGGNSDLGHSIYAIANGYVSEVKDHGGGWGPVLRIVHELDGEYVESLYAHCQDIFVKTGDWVKRGDRVATIGNNNGQYYAHLHLEIREQVDMPLGGGYAKEKEGYLDPTAYIKAHRPK
jgi:murein DD-endopeptidase MepM/ murein hydrolase activator NlpD